jgi:uncharacterized protein
MARLSLAPYSLSRPVCIISQQCLRQVRKSSVTTVPSPLLSRLRDDLKSAMRARDTPRLNVLRGVLADITNSSKTHSPVNDDLTLLALLRKRISNTKQAIDQADEVGRPDLRDKEKEQLDILEGYAGNIKTMGDDEIQETVKDILNHLKDNNTEATLSNIMKKCFGPAGAFEGRMVEKQAVVRIIKAIVAA